MLGSFALYIQYITTVCTYTYIVGYQLSLSLSKFFIDGAKKPLLTNDLSYGEKDHSSLPQKHLGKTCLHE